MKKVQLTHVEKIVAVICSGTISLVNAARFSGARTGLGPSTRALSYELVPPSALPIGARHTLYRRGGKRIIDVLLASVGLVLLSPVIGLAAIAVYCTSRGPLLFRQQRPGRNGAPITVYKLRTMTHRPDRRAEREILRGDAEVTRVGSILRRLKIDELPQLFSVISGDMAIVGPRPGLLEQLPELNAVGRRRLEVRPGLTGLAQVYGNIFLSWPERWQFDADYVDRMSLALDLAILLRTIRVILVGEEHFIKKPSSGGSS